MPRGPSVLLQAKAFAAPDLCGNLLPDRVALTRRYGGARAPEALAKATSVLRDQRLDVIRNLFMGGEPHAGFPLHVLHQPLEHRGT